MAEALFDDAWTDLILRSSDCQCVPVHLYVSKFILSVASPVFGDMVSIPSPAPKPDDKIQVVSLTEDSEALDLSLRHIYPVRPPIVAELCQIRILAEFARKYQVDTLEHLLCAILPIVMPSPSHMDTRVLAQRPPNYPSKFHFPVSYLLRCNTHPRSRMGTPHVPCCMRGGRKCSHIGTELVSIS
jgi:hypothetical protein